MPLYDQHVHSTHSVDSQAMPGDIVECALAKGLAGVTFTEHLDPHPEEWAECVYDHATYSADIERLRARSGEKLFIGRGIEIGYYPPRMDFVLDFLEHHEFDLVILSTHYLGDRAVHTREDWDGLDPAEGTRRYLETVLEMARFCKAVHRSGRRVFHVLGHLDLVKRYTKRFFGTYGLALFSDLIDEILRTCLAADLVPEINTSSLRQNLEEPMPGGDTIARYAQLGGTVVTFGSDAHVSEAVGADFDRALALLQAAGLKQALFKEGKRTEASLA
ncbi:MAG: histidinol-phosphatase HisJ family protein [Planctomycetota bacterium]